MGLSGKITLAVKKLLRKARRRRPGPPRPPAAAPLDERWWRIRVGTEALATFRADPLSRDVRDRRQQRVNLDLALLLQARSLPVAQSRLPEVLASLSATQLLLSAQVFAGGGYSPLSYDLLEELQLSDPSQIWLIDAQALDEG